MEDFIREMWGGPGHLRFFLQPLLAIILGIRDGVADARLERPPYILALATDRALRGKRVREMLKRLTVPLVLGIGLSVVFQLIIRDAVHPAAAVGYGIIFVAMPYMLARALSNRASRPIIRRRLPA
jgi:hypothetical protein